MIAALLSIVVLLCWGGGRRRGKGSMATRNTSSPRHGRFVANVWGENDNRKGVGFSPGGLPGTVLDD
jgi:hypothetical protein